jgi:fermentation-respiration switch protein FrsA (DUF1100 family)
MTPGCPVTRRRRIALAVSLATVAGLVLGGVLVIRSLSRAMMFPGSSERMPPAGELTRARISLLPYTTADGLALTGALARAESPGADFLVYFHGNGEAAAHNLSMAADLAAAGHDVLVAEYRGYGGMPGSPSEAGLYLDAEAAIAALGADKSKLVLVGRSLGTGVAVEMAKRGHAREVVLISPYTSMVDLARLMVGAFAPAVIFDRFDSASKIGALDLPITVIHGTRDDVVPLEMGKRLAGMARRGRLVALDGLGHNDIPDVADRILEALAARSR